MAAVRLAGFQFWLFLRLPLVLGIAIQADIAGETPQCGGHLCRRERAILLAPERTAPIPRSCPHAWRTLPGTCNTLTVSAPPTRHTHPPQPLARPTTDCSSPTPCKIQTMPLSDNPTSEFSPPSFPLPPGTPSRFANGPGTNPRYRLPRTAW